MEKNKIVIGLKNRIEEFLQNLAQKEEGDHWANLKLEQLTEITYGLKEEYKSIKQRYAHLERWFSQEGTELLNTGLSRKQLEEIVKCFEEVKRYNSGPEGDQKNQKETELRDRALKQCSAFIRNSTRRLGLEYTLLGLAEAAWIQEDELKIMEGMRNQLAGRVDLKSEYQRSLSYQNQLLEFFYKPQEHLLSILDYQLKTLEVRHSQEDEFFTSCLINFMKSKKYNVTPYVERFRKAVSAGQK